MLLLRPVILPRNPIARFNKKHVFQSFWFTICVCPCKTFEVHWCVNSVYVGRGWLCKSTCISRKFEYEFDRHSSKHQYAAECEDPSIRLNVSHLSTEIDITIYIYVCDALEHTQSSTKSTSNISSGISWLAWEIICWTMLENTIWTARWASESVNCRTFSRLWCDRWDEIDLIASISRALTL